LSNTEWLLPVPAAAQSKA